MAESERQRESESYRERERERDKERVREKERERRSDFVYLDAEGLVEPAVEAGDAAQVEALGGLVDHATVLHGVRSH